MSGNSSTVPTTDKVNKYLQALTDLEGNIELMKQKDLKLNQSDVLRFLISIEERVKLVSDLLAVHPEVAEYYEGEPCPFCHKDYDEYGDNGEFFDLTEGGGSAGDLEHYYSCPHCNKSWVNISCFKTQEVN